MKGPWAAQKQCHLWAGRYRRWDGNPHRPPPPPPKKKKTTTKQQQHQQKQKTTATLTQKSREAGWGMREAGWKHELMKSHKSAVAITFLVGLSESSSKWAGGKIISPGIFVYIHKFKKPMYDLAYLPLVIM